MSSTAVVAALPEEVAPLRRVMDLERTIRIGPGRFFEGRLDGRGLVVGWTGDGSFRAEAGLRKLLDRVKVDRLLFVGLAGGLSPELPPGRSVVASRVCRPAGETRRPSSTWPGDAAREGLLPVTMVTNDRILATGEAKRRFREELRIEGPATVDLETAAWAAVAEAAGVPWAALRVVSDAVDQDLPLDFERYRGDDGRIRRGRVVLRAFARPSSVVGLLRIARTTRECAARLEGPVSAFLRASEPGLDPPHRADRTGEIGQSGLR